MSSSRPWSEWNFVSSQHETLQVIAFDLDDTLTEQSALRAAVVLGLESLNEAGWRTVLVTGRPAGWADAMIKLLPFDGVVAENGAVIYFWDRGRLLRKEQEEPRRQYWAASSVYQSKPPQADQKELFARAVSQVLTEFPRAQVACDQMFRLYDLAIDFAEGVSPPLSLSDAERMAQILRSLGAIAKVSSIHVNAWWGEFSKAMGLRFLLDEWRLPPPEKSVVYVGDSPNDIPLFQVAAVSVGVANWCHFSGTEINGPQFVTREPCGRGALEVMNRLLSIPRGQRSIAL